MKKKTYYCRIQNEIFPCTIKWIESPWTTANVDVQGIHFELPIFQVAKTKDELCQH